jgi:hypothetical protein
MERSEILALVLVLLGRYLDIITTYAVLGSGLGYEVNPFMRPFSRPLELLALQTLGGLASWGCLVAGARYGRGLRRWLPLAAFLASWPPVLNNLLVILGLHPGPLAFLYGGWSGGS